LDIGGIDALLPLGARLEQGLVQALELNLLGIKTAQINIWRSSGADLVQHGLGAAKVRLLVEEVADPERRQAPAAGKTRILQNSEIELDLVRGLLVEIGRKLAEKPMPVIQSGEPVRSA
jgi:hypothetical protein